MDTLYMLRTEMMGQAVLIILASTPWYLAGRLVTKKLVKRLHRR